MALSFVAVGDVMVDVVAETFNPGCRAHGSVVLRAGGSASNAAMAAAAAGADAAVVGRVGFDAAGRFVADELRAAGVRPLLTQDPAAATGVVVATPAGIVADRGANAFLAPADIPRPLRADVVLVSGYILLYDDSAPAAAEALRQASGRWRAVDAGASSLVERGGREQFFALTRAADAVFASEEEAAALTGEDDARTAAKALAEVYRLACVKRGAAGAVAFLDGRAEEAAADPVAGDVFGAGDVFAATLLVALARGAELAPALAAACNAGARAGCGSVSTS